MSCFRITADTGNQADEGGLNGNTDSFCMENQCAVAGDYGCLWYYFGKDFPMGIGR